MFILLSFILGFSQASASRHDIFEGEAKENGKLVYVEKHDVVFDEKNNPLEATTTYVDADGTVAGVLRSDFRRSLNLPEHLYVDNRTGNRYGIRRAGDKVILFSQDAGKEEETKEMPEGDDRERLQVGCQGFNYYLKGKVDAIKQAKSKPVLFMIPGNLSSYRFVLKYLKENPDQTVEFEVKIENWFLRAFAPNLEFRYDQKINRIVWYKGVSNIKNKDGKTMNVVINYKY